MKEKDYSISAVRMVAMCMIILCHFAQYYNSFLAWWLNVGVQVFFIISGFLYGRKVIVEPVAWVGRQFKKILVPYYVFLFIAGALYFFSDEGLSLSVFMDAVFCIDTIDGIGHLWFIQYILFCYLITPYLQALRMWLEKKPLWTGMGYFFAILLVFNVVLSPIYEFLNSVWISCYILGYFGSFYAQKLSGHWRVTAKYMVVCLAVLANGLRAYCYYVIRCTDFVSPSTFKYFEHVSHLLLGFAVFIVLSALFRNVKGNCVLSFSDQYSYPIYIVHQLFILSPFSLMMVTAIPVVNVGIVLMSILVAGVLLQKVASGRRGKACGRTEG